MATAGRREAITVAPYFALRATKDRPRQVPFDIAPFDIAPFDIAPFDIAQGLRQGKKAVPGHRTPNYGAVVAVINIRGIRVFPSTRSARSGQAVAKNRCRRRLSFSGALPFSGFVVVNQTADFL